MDDLISRAEAIDAPKRKQDDGKGDLSRFYNTIIQHDIEAIMQLPPIQPKRGKWIKTARWGMVYYCDQCRNYLDFDGVNAGRGSANYCPNCGCRMDGGEQ